MTNGIVRKLAVVAAVVLLPAAALAKPQMGITVKAEKEVTVQEKGKKVHKLVEVREVEPGEVIQYTVAWENRGSEPAVDAVIDDPIPPGTAYIDGSATSEGADLSFSIDNGKSFKKPSLLTYQVQQGGKSESKTASAEKYTNIRWTLPKVAAGAKGSFTFKVRVK